MTTSATIDRNLREVRAARRRGLRRAAPTLGLAAAGCVALATRMSDIGRAAGFAASRPERRSDWGPSESAQLQANQGAAKKWVRTHD